jgi:hypothetical protein
VNKFQTKDSTLAYYIHQLENLDKTLYEPLVDIQWGRDIKLRSGITMANESTSFIRSSLAYMGSTKATGKPWLNPNSNTLPGVSINGEKITTPLRLLGREVSYNSVELERSQLVGQPIDQQKFNALNLSYQLDTDEMVYIGDAELGVKGLLNSSLVTAGSALKTFATATPDEILSMVNEILTAAWTASAFAVCPDKLLLPPVQFGLLVTTKVSTAGNMSLLEYIKVNSICNSVNGRPLDIQPCKWLTSRGTNSTDRMMAYTNNESRVRFPMVPIRREQAYYQSINFIAPYIWAFGEVEFVFPETALYRDGI